MTQINFYGINFILTAKTAEKATRYMQALEVALDTHDCEDCEIALDLADALASDLSYEEWVWR